MVQTTEEKSDIKCMVEQLSEENKRYVIAVANALLFSQKKDESDPLHNSIVRRT